MTQQYTPFYLLVFLKASRRWEDAAYTDMHTKKSALERKGQIEASVQKEMSPQALTCARVTGRSNGNTTWDNKRETSTQCLRATEGILWEKTSAKTLRAAAGGRKFLWCSSYFQKGSSRHGENGDVQPLSDIYEG